MRVLALNCGGSSVKHKVFAMPAEKVRFQGSVERLGSERATPHHQDLAAGTDYRQGSPPRRLPGSPAGNPPGRRWHNFFPHPDIPGSMPAGSFSPRSLKLVPDPDCLQTQFGSRPLDFRIAVTFSQSAYRVTISQSGDTTRFLKLDKSQARE